MKGIKEFVFAIRETDGNRRAHVLIKAKHVQGAIRQFYQMSTGWEIAEIVGVVRE